MSKQDLAILFSGSIDSLALYALSSLGKHPEIPKPRMIHILCMQNRTSRFPEFPLQRFEMAEKILKRQAPFSEPMPKATLIELDMGRLFQGMWLDRYEALMPRYDNKNLVCVACKLAMHTRAVLYCAEQLVPLLIAGDTRHQFYSSEQAGAFIKRITSFSEQLGITTRFPVHDDFDDNTISKNLLEDYGLPSTNGGETKCLFSQTLTTASEIEIGKYLDQMIPRASQYVENRLEGRVKEAVLCLYSETFS